jgi:phosphoglycerol transferase
MINEQGIKPSSGGWLKQLFARPFERPGVRSAALYLGTVLIGVLIVASLFDLRKSVRGYPYDYLGDTLFYHSMVKGVIDHGWYLTNPSLGAPGVLDMRDVPSSDNNFHMVLVKLLALRNKHYPGVLNNFFLLTFPLTIIAALYALRRLGVSWTVSSWAALLFTMLPYHFTRGEQHLFLAAYWQIPLLVLVLLWICRAELWTFEQTQRWPRVNWRDRRLLGALALCVLLGSSGYYYAFFACFFLLMAGLIAALQQRRAGAFVVPVVLIAVISAFVVLNLLPSIIHLSRHGSVMVVQRVAAEAEAYGLRIGQLLMPVRWHRVQALSDLKVAYNMRIFITENDDATLGLIGACGFLGLLWWFFFCKPAVRELNEPGARGVFNHLSALNLSAVLLGTIGGFGSLVAFFGLPQIRAYTRLSIFIACLVFFALAFWLDGVRERRVRTRGQQWLFNSVLVITLVLGLLDQITPMFIPDYVKFRNDFESDRAFVQQVEAKLQPSAMIFQLPAVSFPENPKFARMSDYDLLRGYLHSKTLRWSYGTIKGREGDVWMRAVALKPTAELVETLAWSGFSGVYVDRFGYTDNGAKLEGELKSLLGGAPVISSNQRLVFYDLRPYQQNLLAQVPQGEHAARREAALYPPTVVWQEGFSDFEGTAEENWRWGGAKARAVFVNRTGQDKPVHLEMTLAVDNGGTLEMSSPFFSERLQLNKSGQKFSKDFTLPPGEHFVYFKSDGKRVLSPSDFRELVFRVRNFKLISTETAAPAPLAAVWPTGFYELERNANENWRWCGAQGQAKLVNRTAQPTWVDLEMTLAVENGGTLEMTSPFFNERLKLDKAGTKFVKRFNLPPGEHAINFKSDGKRVVAPNETRELVFRVRDFKLEAAEGEPAATPAPQPSARAQAAAKAAGR